MILSRIVPSLLLAALAACGASKEPEAAPGSVERLAAQLDRNAAVERAETVSRIDREAEERKVDFEQRIAAIEKPAG